MAFLDRTSVKKIVSRALHKVADFNGDVDTYSFGPFQEYHKVVFLNELRKEIIEHPYLRQDGTTSTDRYYDVPLSLQVMGSWQSVKDCLEYTLNNQAVRQRPAKLNL
jgi:hypothetical protein